MDSDLETRLILPSLIGDALALGPHWEYDPAKIAEKFGTCVLFHDPMSSYHPGKRAGDQTHYGDQTILLWRFLREANRWDAGAFKDRWMEYWKASASYRDHATRSTLEQGAGSSSDELGGPARLAPLLAFFADRPLAGRVAAAREQTALTHASALATDAAEFVTRVTDALQGGLSFTGAAQKAAEEGHYAELRPAGIIQQAVQETDPDTVAALGVIGRACPTPQALPAVMLIAIRHGDTPGEALSMNARSGGDSAARGLVLGLWLGASHGADWIPREWREGLACRHLLNG